MRKLAKNRIARTTPGFRLISRVAPERLLIALAVLLCSVLATSGTGGWQSGPAVAGPAGRVPAGLGGHCLACTPFITVSASHTQITVQGANFSSGTHVWIELINAAAASYEDVSLTGSQPVIVVVGTPCYALWCRLNPGSFSAQATQTFDPCPGDPYAPFGAAAIRAAAAIAVTGVLTPTLPLAPSYTASTTVSC